MKGERKKDWVNEENKSFLPLLLLMMIVWWFPYSLDALQRISWPFLIFSLSISFSAKHLPSMFFLDYETKKKKTPPVTVANGFFFHSSLSLSVLSISLSWKFCAFLFILIPLQSPLSLPLLSFPEHRHWSTELLLWETNRKGWYKKGEKIDPTAWDRPE